MGPGSPVPGIPQCNRKRQFASCYYSQRTFHQIKAYSGSIPGLSDIFLGMITTNDPEHKSQIFDNQAATALSINTLHYNNLANPLTVNLDNNNSIKFKLDKGAEIDVLPKEIHNKLHQRPRLSPTSISPTANNSTNIPVLGKCKASVNYKNVVTPIMFIVADTNSQLVLSITTCKKLNLIKCIFQIHPSLPQKISRLLWHTRDSSKYTPHNC